jgi:hypothetical protein
MSMPTDLIESTLTLLRGIAGFGQTTFEARTNPIAQAELPALNVFMPSAKLSPGTINGGFWNRNDALVIVAEFTAKSDQALHRLGIAIQAAVWAALQGSQTWRDLWRRQTSWDIDSGRDGESEVRRGIVRITIAGDWQQDPPDPSDMTPLREIRAAMAIDGSEEPAAETRLECDGAEDE